MTKVLWHLEVISWHCCSVMQVVMKLKLFHIFGVVASWLDKPRRVCSHSLCAPLSLSARLRFVVNADNGNVDCRHGLCASVVCTVSKNDWDYDDEHLCCCEKLLKLCVTARTGHFHSHLGEQDLAGRRRVRWCHELSGAELSPGFQCVTLTFGCVCRDGLAAYSCQGTNVPVCKLIQTPPHLSGASQRAEVPEASDALAIGCSWCCVDLGVSCTCCRHSRAGTKLWHCFPFRRDTSEGVGSSIDLLQSHSLA